MMTPLALMKWCAGVGVVVGYIGLAHYTLVTPGNAKSGAFLALTPIAVAAVSIAWRSPHRSWIFAFLMACCFTMLLKWTSIEHHYSTIYWLEHAGTQSLLCLAFARSLAPGREAMCSFFARLLHGELTLTLQRYTRHVTIAWVIFFGLMAATSTVLYFTTSVASWSTFANFMTAPLTCLMFLGEYIVRRILLPEFDHVPIWMAVKAYWNAPAGR